MTAKIRKPLARETDAAGSAHIGGDAGRDHDDVAAEGPEDSKGGA